MEDLGVHPLTLNLQDLADLLHDLLQLIGLLGFHKQLVLQVNRDLADLLLHLLLLCGVQARHILSLITTPLIHRLDSYAINNPNSLQFPPWPHPLPLAHDGVLIKLTSLLILPVLLEGQLGKGGEVRSPVRKRGHTQDVLLLGLHGQFSESLTVRFLCVIFSLLPRCRGVSPSDMHEFSGCVFGDDVVLGVYPQSLAECLEGQFLCMGLVIDQLLELLHKNVAIQMSVYTVYSLNLRKGAPTCVTKAVTLIIPLATSQQKYS